MTTVTIRSPKEIDSEVHRALLQSVIRKGHLISEDDLSAGLDLDVPSFRLSLRRLSEDHGLVLHPGTHEPWIIHPFSLSPTNVWVRSGHQGWWAPCLWCALGITTLIGGTSDIGTMIGAEDEFVKISIREFRILDPSLLVHFSVPPRDAWSNVIHFCSTVLPFRRESEVDDWSYRHHLNRGVVIPVTQVLELARNWYGKHLEPNWAKWTINEASEIFDKVGLSGPFWELPQGNRPY
jgi:hypothetical protein